MPNAQLIDQVLSDMAMSPQHFLAVEDESWENAWNVALNAALSHAPAAILLQPYVEALERVAQTQQICS